MSFSRPPLVQCATLSALSLLATSCTDLMLARYRHDDLLRDYRYALDEQYVDVGGLKLCYQEKGQGENVLIIPGLGTNIDFWQLSIPVLAEQYRVLALDPPGFGKSDKPDVSYDLQWLSEQIVAFMDARKVERTSFIGASLGGHLALMITLAHPERVNKLVLMGSCGAWPRTGFLLDATIKMLWNDAMVTDHLRRNWPTIYDRMFDRQTELTQRLFRYQMAVRARMSTYADEGRAESRSLRSIFYHSCRDRMSEIKRPALLIWGQHDQWHLPNEAAYFRSHLPDSRLVVVQGSGHEVMIDQTEVFNKTVLSFLAGGTQAVREQGYKPR
jgi:pimeloyl-ACP methyl ester carboxylesterase